jgi:Glycoside-hydrolase family GH114
MRGLVVIAAAVLAVAGCSSGGGSEPDAAAVSGSSSPSSSSPSSSSADAPTVTADPTGSASSASHSPSPSTSSGSGAPSNAPAPAKAAAPPPTGVRWDYQIGGAYAPPAGVRIVSRDSSASPASGLYNICYINAFQAQPDATGWWQSNHPDLLLKTASGAPVIDQNWNEQLLDVSTDAKRTALAQIESGWIAGCAAKGFQAVEADNLDSYSRSQGALTADDDVAMATQLARLAHAKGLAIGQKNTTELLPRAHQIGFDFAVSEQCGKYGECGGYASTYADHVVDVEYDATGFATACRDFGGKIAIVLRDMDVSPAGGSSYVYKSC